MIVCRKTLLIISYNYEIELSNIFNKRYYELLS